MKFKVLLKITAEDPQVGVIVLTGAGERAFCSGGDVNWEATKEFKKHEYELHRHLTECPKPVIARVNGYAIGGGNHMAYYCDLTHRSRARGLRPKRAEGGFAGGGCHCRPSGKYFGTQARQRNVADMSPVFGGKNAGLGAG